MTTTKTDWYPSVRLGSTIFGGNMDTGLGKGKTIFRVKQAAGKDIALLYASVITPDADGWVKVYLGDEPSGVEFQYFRGKTTGGHIFAPVDKDGWFGLQAKSSINMEFDLRAVFS